MNVHELKRCDCGVMYYLCAPADYKDSGRCQDCDDEVEWLNKNVGVEAAYDPQVTKDRQPDQWSAFLGLMIVLLSAAVVTTGIYAAIYRVTR